MPDREAQKGTDTPEEAAAPRPKGETPSVSTLFPKNLRDLEALLSKALGSERAPPDQPTTQTLEGGAPRQRQ
jgi:hypothetical protein